VPLVVLVPDDAGLGALEHVPGVSAVRYRLGEPLPDGAAHAQVIVVTYRDVDRAVALMRTLPRLRLVQTLNAGTEQWRGRLPDGVALSNARGAHGGSTAEWAVAALLSIYRDFSAFAEQQQEQVWRGHVTETLIGRRVLVLGAGDLAVNLRRRLTPFEATTTLVGRRAREGVEGVEALPDLIAEHDAVVVMLPLTDATHHIVDAAFLARMRDGGVLVNAARGGLVDTDALLAELRRGRLRAALDVTEPEPLPPEHPLWRAPGVLITPHVAGATAGSQERGWAVAAEQIAQFAAGREPDNVVR
jgi:phosphoglycerate dehydrogenase-like enzyme